MKKRLKIIVALVGALVLLFSLAVPCLAAVDWSAYPTSNLIYPYSYSGDGTIQGVTFEKAEDGSIQVKGTATANFTYWFCQGLEMPAGTYSFGYHTPVNTGANISPSEGSFFQSFGGTFTVESSFRISVYFSMKSGVTYDSVFQVKLFKGSTEYPYQPCVQVQLDDAYEQGVDVAVDDFFNEYPDLGSAFRKISSLSVVYQESGDSGVRICDYLSYEQLLAIDGFVTSSGAVNISAYVRYLGYDESDINYLSYISFEFRWNYDYSTVSSDIYVTGSATSNYYSLYKKVSDNAVELAASYIDKYSADLQMTRELPFSDTSFSSFEAKYYGAAYLIGGTATYPDVTIDIVNGGSYDEGYVDGLQTGLTVNNQGVYDAAYEKGETFGYSQGFVDGKLEGLEIAESGSWTELMLAVCEAPINTFQSLFNFEILGLDMRAAFGSILTLCVVLIVIKKVVL